MVYPLERTKKGRLDANRTDDPIVIRPVPTATLLTTVQPYKDVVEPPAPRSLSREREGG